MHSLSIDHSERIQLAIEGYVVALAAAGISLRVQRNFENYAAIRRINGDGHLNQAFDPRNTRFGPDDFWLLAENRSGEAIATCCLRRFVVDDFYVMVRSQKLWFSNPPRHVDPRFVVDCGIPPFGGDVSHIGGLWVRGDYRGCYRLANVMPQVARAITLRDRPFDHDSAMIRNDPQDRPQAADRKAGFLGKRTYGFARVHRFVSGWFPPERRNAIMYLCHSTRDEAVGSLVGQPPRVAPTRLRSLELGQVPLVDEHKQLVGALAVGG